MRIGSRIAACLIATAFATVALAAYKAPSRAPLRVDPSSQIPKASRFLAFGSLATQLDNHVLANLLTDAPLRQIDTPLAVVAGDITRCGSHTCAVPLTLRVNDAQGPVMVAFAVANARGELSDVHHAECGTGTCSVSLVLERGRNTISVGVIDGLSQTTAYTRVYVNANRVVARNGKTEWF
ncbi:MAG TPA: hypothetical protein VER58_17455 [Thermoanaerobaculia bacterium]|nr:hypothetical protein [Thermoanaerobaculia bacterium]